MITSHYNIHTHNLSCKKVGTLGRCFFYNSFMVIKYKKGVHNKVADMLSRPPIQNALIILQNSSMVHESFQEQYANDENFKDI